MALVDDLAQEIRRVDGGHDLGAGALAEGIEPFVRSLVETETERLRSELADARYALGIHSGVKDGHEGIDGDAIERAIKAL